MTDLEKYEAVNKTTNLEELADVIRSFASNGIIEGRTKIFNAEEMAKRCETYAPHKHNNLTRKYGIRQQALMFLFYDRIIK